MAFRTASKHFLERSLTAVGFGKFVDIVSLSKEPWPYCTECRVRNEGGIHGMHLEEVVPILAFII